MKRQALPLTVLKQQLQIAWCSCRHREGVAFACSGEVPIHTPHQHYHFPHCHTAHTHTHAQAPTHKHPRTRAHAHARTRTHMREHRRACTHTHTHTHTHMREHRHTPDCFLASQPYVCSSMVWYNAQAYPRSFLGQPPKGNRAVAVVLRAVRVTRAGFPHGGSGAASSVLSLAAGLAGLAGGTGWWYWLVVVAGGGGHLASGLPCRLTSRLHVPRLSCASSAATAYLAATCKHTQAYLSTNRPVPC